MIIRDTSFECDDHITSNRFHKVELTDEDKLDILEQRGGHIINPYMAQDETGAYRNFRNMLPVTMEQQVRMDYLNCHVTVIHCF